MKIKFHETLYNLLSMPNIMSTHFQASFEKGENTFDSIVEDTLNTDEITVYDDEDEVSGIYTGYTKRIALYVLDGNESISVEFENSDIQAQIDALTASITAQKTEIDSLSESVEELTPYTETKTAYYNESEKTFYNVPEGNVQVFFDNYNGEYSVNRVADRVIVSFDTLAQATNITISVN